MNHLHRASSLEMTAPHRNSREILTISVQSKVNVDTILKAKLPDLSYSGGSNRKVSVATVVLCYTTISLKIKGKSSYHEPSAKALVEA